MVGKRGRDVAAVSRSFVVERGAWECRVELPDGSSRSLANASGRFLPLHLEAGAVCKFAVSGPGLLPGRTAVLSCSCGGLVEGTVTASVPVSPDGVLRFSFRNGNNGVCPECR